MLEEAWDNKFTSYISCVHVHLRKETRLELEKQDCKYLSYRYLTHYNYAPELAVSMISATVVEGLLPLPHSSIRPYLVLYKNSTATVLLVVENVKIWDTNQDPTRLLCLSQISPASTKQSVKKIQCSCWCCYSLLAQRCSPKFNSSCMTLMDSVDTLFTVLLNLATRLSLWWWVLSFLARVLLIECRQYLLGPPSPNEHCP